MYVPRGTPGVTWRTRNLGALKSLASRRRKYSAFICFDVGLYFLFLLRNTLRDSVVGFMLARFAVATIPAQLNVLSARAAVACTIKYVIATRMNPWYDAARLYEPWLFFSRNHVTALK